MGGFFNANCSVETLNKEKEKSAWETELCFSGRYRGDQEAG
jgi:hypothetical protein